MATDNTPAPPAPLLASRRFLPLFATQFLGAFNDNLFKNALVILITYRLAERTGDDPRLLVTAAAGVFILPFFLFSATAGQLADRWEKSRLIRLIKLGEVLIMALAAVGFHHGSPHLLLAILFLMGTQSAFFGPLKYAILPDHLARKELVAGNGFIEAGTFLAILLGTIAGGLLILAPGGITLVSAALLAMAVAGWLASRAIPTAPAPAPDLTINWNVFSATWAMLGHARGERSIFLSILGISWFWLVGATFLAQFPTLAKVTLQADQEVVTLFLTLFSVGIGVGSLLCARLLHGRVDARHVPLGALAMSLFIFDLYHAAKGGVAPAAGLHDAASFLAHPAHWRVLLDLTGLAVAGGVYIVPLYALLQSRGAESHRARDIAANNVVNALFMVFSALATMAMLTRGWTVPQVFLALGLANLGVALYICRLLPDAVLKALFATLFRLLYRVQVRGWDNYHKAGDRVVMVMNHVSFLDAALLATYLPEKPTFAINTHIAQRWWVKPFLSVIDAFPLDPGNPYAVKALTRGVQEGRKLVIFPEGRITVTGALMKVYEGPGMIADRAGADILPIRIDGAQCTPFSRLRGKLRLRWFPTITITMLPPRRLPLPPELKGRERRRRIGVLLYDLLTEMLVETADLERTLFRALADARRIHGDKHLILEDPQRKPLTYGRLLAGCITLGRTLARHTPGEARVGLMLPNASASAVAFFGLQAMGRVPAMLNHTTGVRNLLSAVKTAQLRTVVTSRRFIAMARLEETAAALDERVRLLYLEDLAAELGMGRKLIGLALAWLDRLRPWGRGADPDAPAVVLFTSGSEGLPKGVVLSHRNILANCHQLSARVDYNPTDTVFNALPIFHSFGLTGGMILPMVMGIRTFLYPSPLHYRIVPEMVYDTNATILFGTDTFLSGYARMANPYDFYSVRHVFAGAEKVRESTRATWMERFGLRILEGYGATETAPALATNTPMHFRAGSVGRLLPRIHHRLEPVPGITEGGRLVVRGPNVMLGYLKAERPGELQPPPGGEYDTGDIVAVDVDGFVTILGRAKRFAKVAGEMISLGAVEELAARCWPAHQHAVVTLADPRKGEQLVLVSNCPHAERGALLAHAKTAGAAELMVPRVVRVVERLPLLGTGKVDYVALQGLVAQEP